ncbi:hypothetical protein [Komagataeibacter swingsii]|uniref:Uncharacterized protein n=1 Tax=Komagataeibacter swingsii TaxID=215220 RepID=A0A2V4S881_9PROT|nr:hypothetical protein [Komagataeibacter swingsii]PYD68258.1 hypothetical protein CFR76_16040 [Komagataeibacter swingsii]GBQ57972.1 hypothetical protein AA16373_1147 [Komagataeibacter swingsii DSM 16373]
MNADPFILSHASVTARARSPDICLDRSERLTDSGLSVEEAVHEVRLAANLSRITVMDWRR